MTMDSAIHSPADRVFGLDVCRTLAVLLVVTGHMLQHSMPHPTLASFGFIGLFGVDIFFCLSGFLIGRILLKESVRWPDEKEAGLLHFWYRRWMRTLPLYIFFLIISLSFDWTGSSNIDTKLSYLIFAQNMAWEMPKFYGLTWSLAVEEWFYFTFPLLILMLIGLGRQPRKAVALSIVFFIIMPPFFRFLFTGEQHDFGSLDEGIRHIMVFRMDSIGYGVLIAYMEKWHDTIFLRLIKSWWVFLGLIIVCMTFTKFNYFGYSESRLTATIYFSITGLSFACLIPLFRKIKPPRYSLIRNFVKYTSKISYSMYLGHIFAFIIGINLLKIINLYETTYFNPWLLYPIFYFLIYIISSFTYYFIEKPFLLLRDRKSKLETNLPGKNSLIF